MLPSLFGLDNLFLSAHSLDKLYELLKTSDKETLLTVTDLLICWEEDFAKIKTAIGEPRIKELLNDASAEDEDKEILGYILEAEKSFASFSLC